MTTCPECRDTGWTYTHTHADEDSQPVVDACWRCTVLAEVEYQTYERATGRAVLTLKRAA